MKLVQNLKHYFLKMKMVREQKKQQEKNYNLFLN